MKLKKQSQGLLKLSEWFYVSCISLYHYMYLGKVAVRDLLRFCWEYHGSNEPENDLGIEIDITKL